MEKVDKKDNSAVTFVVFTYNEEKRIEWAIKNFEGWGHVLIVDNFSEDRTVEIAKSYGCEVLLNKNPGWCEDSETVAKVKAAVKSEWIYWGFADEVVGESALAAIMEAVQSGKFRIVNIIRKNYYYGKFCHDAYAARLNRIFEKNAIDFSNNTIHHFGDVTVPESEICYLDPGRYYVHHFMALNAKNWLHSMDRYSEIQSTTYSGSFAELRIGVRLIKTLLGNYIVRGAYRAGFAGWALVIEMIYYECLLTMKSYERKRGLTVPEIEVLNNSARRALLNSGRA